MDKQMSSGIEGCTYGEGKFCESECFLAKMVNQQIDAKDIEQVTNPWTRTGWGNFIERSFKFAQVYSCRQPDLLRNLGERLPVNMEG